MFLIWKLMFKGVALNRNIIIPKRVSWMRNFLLRGCSMSADKDILYLHKILFISSKSHYKKNIAETEIVVGKKVQSWIKIGFAFPLSNCSFSITEETLLEYFLICVGGHNFTIIQENSEHYILIQHSLYNHYINGAISERANSHLRNKSIYYR